MRLFTALDIPSHLHPDIKDLQSDLPNARWSPATNWHITLNFLGDVNENMIADIDDALMQLDMDDFQICLQGFGCFTDEGRAQYLWAKPMPDENLHKCHQKLQRLLEKEEIIFEKRHFVPHMTLAKVKKTPEATLKNYITENEKFKSTFFFAENVILYQSHLSKHGSIYREIAKYPLKRASQIR